MGDRERSISIVIPSINASQTLGAAIESVTNQKEVESEIVVVDDGSTDDTLSVAHAYEADVHIISGPNRGASAARNLGFLETKSEWIVYLDADDVLLPGTLARRLGVVNTTASDVIICDWQEFYDHDGKTTDGKIKSVDMRAVQEDPEIAFATEAWAPPAALMYRRTLVEKIGGFRDDLPVIQDARFLFDAAFNGAHFAHSAHIGARYRILPESLSRRSSSQFWLDVLTNGRQIEALWRGRSGLTPARKRALASIYDHASRGLFTSEQSEYFEAVECERRLGGRLPLHPRLVTPISRVFGMHITKRVLQRFGR